MSSNLTLTLPNGSTIVGDAASIQAFLVGSPITSAPKSTKKAAKVDHRKDTTPVTCADCGKVENRGKRAKYCHECSEARQVAFTGSRNEFGRKREALRALKAAGKVAAGVTVKEYLAAGNTL